MHNPEQFKQNDPNRLYDIVRRYPFATLVTHSKLGLEANHIPFFLNQSNGKDVLQGHIAKANPLWKNIEDSSDVLAIFNGPNCYISPNHYPTKRETGRVVPTWNYVAVHATGVMLCIHDEKWKLEMLNNLTTQHEAQQPKPWSIADAPETYIKKMIPAIVGLEIDASSIEGKWKVSQNQPEQNRQGVIGGLSEESDSDAQKIARLVKEYGSQQ